MLELLIKWLREVVRTLPIAVVHTIAISVIVNMIKYLFYKTKYVKCNKLKFRKLKENSNDEKKIHFVESPKIDVPTQISSTITIKTSSDSNEDLITILLFSIVISSVISGFFIEYVEIIADILKISSIIPIYLCILIIVKILVSNKVQKMTIKYIFYTIIVSSLTLYYGSNLVELTKIMTSSTQDLKLLGHSMQIIAGVGLAFFQQILSYIMLLRVILVFLYFRMSKENKALNKFLYKTESFEHLLLLMTLTILLSAISIYFTKILYS